MSTDIIPAQPGYHLLNIVFADDGDLTGFEKTPVIGWKISYDYTYPVGDAHSLADAVMRPDGSVYITGERANSSKEFEDAATALQYFAFKYSRPTTNNT